MSKGLDALKDIRDTYIDSWYGVHRCETIEKELKALEIIKNKTVSACNCIMILKSRTDNLSYECYKSLFLTELTYEEYDLLKEVLINE